MGSRAWLARPAPFQHLRAASRASRSCRSATARRSPSSSSTQAEIVGSTCRCASVNSPSVRTSRIARRGHLPRRAIRFLSGGGRPRWYRAVPAQSIRTLGTCRTSRVRSSTVVLSCAQRRPGTACPCRPASLVPSAIPVASGTVGHGTLSAPSTPVSTGSSSSVLATSSGIVEGGSRSSRSFAPPSSPARAGNGLEADQRRGQRTRLVEATCPGRNPRQPASQDAYGPPRPAGSSARLGADACGRP